MIDCSGIIYGTYGCGGGFFTSGWDYLKSAPGIASTASYPFRGRVIMHFEITP
jgi:Papain family cysteine protease